MNRKILGVVVSFIAVAMLASPVLAIGPIAKTGDASIAIAISDTTIPKIFLFKSTPPFGPDKQFFFCSSSDIFWR